MELEIKSLIETLEYEIENIKYTKKRLTKTIRLNKINSK